MISSKHFKEGEKPLASSMVLLKTITPPTLLQVRGCISHSRALLLLNMRMKFDHGKVNMRMKFDHGKVNMRMKFDHGKVNMRMIFDHGKVVESYLPHISPSSDPVLKFFPTAKLSEFNRKGARGILNKGDSIQPLFGKNISTKTIFGIVIQT